MNMHQDFFGLWHNQTVERAHEVLFTICQVPSLYHVIIAPKLKCLDELLVYALTSNLQSSHVALVKDACAIPLAQSIDSPACLVTTPQSHLETPLVCHFKALRMPHMRLKPLMLSLPTLILVEQEAKLASVLAAFASEQSFRL